MNRKMFSRLKWGLGFILAFVLVFPYNAYSQESGYTDYTRPFDVISPSPVAASLFKDVNVPVNYYTGTPQIDIPLHVIKGGKLKMPIHLKYTASGIRVEQEAGLTGLAWDLQTGGVISRAIVGKADELPGGIGYRSAAQGVNFPDPGHDDSLSIWESTVSTCKLEDIGEGKKDLAPDSYFLNFNGNGAKMVFDKYGQPYFSPYKKWKITGDETNGFTVITEDGTTYIFSITESSHDIIETQPMDQLSTTTNNTSWYLTQIISADKADTIRLNYAQLTYHPASYHVSESKGYLITGQQINNAVQPNTDFSSNTMYTHQISGYLLSDITTRDEKVVFYCNLGRTDIVDGNDGMPYKLDSIRYFSMTPDGAQLLSSVLFNYDYYNAGATRLEQRLRLLSVSEMGAKGEKGDVYKFHYDGDNDLPARNSYGEDNWGFSNGGGGTTLIPTFTDENGHTFAGADRDPDPAESIKGLLTSIEYPTGGTTSFQYEAHMYNNHAPGQRDSLTLTQNLNVHTGPEDNTTLIFDSVSFHIPFEQFVTIFCSSNARAGEEADVIAYLVQGIGTQLNPNIWEYDAPALPHSASFTKKLGPGTYTLCVKKDHITGERGSATLTYQYHVVDPSIGTLAGGARIKRMVQSDGIQQIVKNFRYLADSVTSSGKLLTTPVYSGLQNVPAMCTCTGGGQVGNWRYQVFHSMPTADLGRTQGSHICYTHVTVVNGDAGENGTEEYDYQFTKDIGNGAYPYAPLGSMDDFRGQLLTKKIYDASGKLIEREDNSYNLFADWNYPNFKQIWGVKVGITKKGDVSSGGCPLWSPTLGGWDFNVAFYPVLQLWPTLASTKKTLFSSNSNDSIVTVEAMGYDPSSLQLSVKKAWLSKGDSLTDYLKYPNSFSGTPVYDTMIARNMLTSVIEHDQYYNTTLRSKGVLNYQLWSGAGGTVPLPASTQLQLGSNPIETRLQYLGYDNNSNLLSQKKSADVTHSYVWDYWGHTPIAEVVNATPADIAFTSFEWDGSGGFAIASSQRIAGGVTGAKAYNLSNGNITKSGLNSSKNYIVSYWSSTGSSFTVTGSGSTLKGRTVNGWTYFQHTVSGTSSVTISGAANIDELRLYPQGAQMTSYTFAPLVGMTSQCDATSKITNYEYDGLQRLVRIRDMDGNIVKQYEYQYQVSTGCGNGCYILQMTTFAGTNTLSYPVGVFNVNGKLLGNATNQSQYISLWNADTADANRGTLAAGGDSLHFNFTLTPGKTMPMITGCRYYQVDLAYNKMDGVRNWNGCYVDWGDGTGMRLAANLWDPLPSLPPNTTQSQSPQPQFDRWAWYFVHTYADNSLKTLTFYHNDATENTMFDNVVRPAPNLTYLKNLRGNLPQHTTMFGGNNYQQASMMQTANITNWNSIHSIYYFGLGSGDGTNFPMNPSYEQDFMAGNKDLDTISISAYSGATFKLSRLKSDWSTYFTHLSALTISDAQWDREDLSVLKELNYFLLFPANGGQVPQNVVDSIFNQIAAGAGQTVSNGALGINSGGVARSHFSDAAVAALTAKGWLLYIDGTRIN